MKSLLVIGGGFVGLTTALLAAGEGIKVTILDRRPSAEVLPPNVSAKQVDLISIEDVAPFLPGYDNAAWCLRPLTDNKLASEVSREIRMCYMSSLAVYAPDIPTADEDSPVNPRTEYGRLKAIEEAAVLGAGSAVVLRSTGLYGPQVEAARLSRSARSILTAVNAAKSGAEAVDVEFSEIADQYLHVYDLVSAVLGLLAAESVAGLFNVGPGERHPTQELGRILSDVLGIRVRPVITEDGPPSPVLRTSRLERVLPSWFSRPLEVGVEQLLGRSG